MQKSKFLYFLLIVIFFAACNANKKETNNLKIIATSDIHGSVFPYDFIEDVPLNGSLSVVSTYLEKARNNKDTTVLLLDNGDILQGQPPVYYYNYIDTSSIHIMAEIMNFLEYDAATVGNHDIEAGHSVYDKLVDDFNFPWLAANAIEEETGEPYFKPYTIITKGTIDIAILGLITPSVPNWLPSYKYSGIQFNGIKTAAQKWMSVIQEKENPDFIIGLVHSGFGEENNDSLAENAVYDLAKNVQGFNLIIYGHDHQRKNIRIENNEGDSVTIINPGAYASSVAEVDLQFSTVNNKSSVGKISSDIVDISNYEPSESFNEKFSKHKAKIENFIDEKLTVSPINISTRDAFFRPSEWMTLIHQVQIETSEADISFAAPLSRDKTITKGDITVRDLFKLYRFENSLYTIELSGKEIKKYLEYSYGKWFQTMYGADDYLLNFKKDSTGKPIYSKDQGYYVLKEPYYNFDSAWGIDYIVDVTEPAGERIEIKQFSNGQAFFMDQYYEVALNSYRANGGGGHLTEGVGLDKKEIEERILAVNNKDIRRLIRKNIENQDTLVLNYKENWTVYPEKWWKQASKRDSLMLFSGR
ncbi:MAG: bifunctional metallophosphatase/5'-nucleotidase [Bacteroidales bacterium]